MSKEIEEINLIADLIEDFYNKQDEIGQESSTTDKSESSNEDEADKINTEDTCITSNNTNINNPHKHSNSEDDVDMNTSSPKKKARYMTRLTETVITEPVLEKDITSERLMKKISHSIFDDDNSQNKVIDNVSDNLPILDVLSSVNELVESCTDSLGFCDKLALLLKYCQRPEVPLYLIKNKLLHKILDINPTCDKDKNESTTIILQIFIKYFTDETLQLLSNDKEFFINLINRIQCSNECVLYGLFVFIDAKVIPHIQQNRESKWIFRLKQFDNFQKVIGTLLTDKEYKPKNGALLNRMIKMLRTMSETYVSFGTYLFGYLFNSKELIQTLLIYCARVIKTEKYYFRKKINICSFTLHWQSLMINAIRHKDYTFQECNNRYNMLFNMILYEILKSYGKSHTSFLIMHIKPEQINIIRKCMNIMSFSYYKALSPKLYRSLMNLAFRIKTGLDSRKEVTPQEDLYKLVSDFKLYWLWMIEKCDEITLFDIMHICKPRVRQYISNLVTSDGTSDAKIKFMRGSKLGELTLENL